MSSRCSPIRWRKAGRCSSSIPAAGSVASRRPATTPMPPPSSAGTSCHRSPSRAPSPRSPAGRRPTGLRVIDSETVADQRIADLLAGKRLLLTGVTGFVGEALLERILHDLPDTSVVVVVRARGGASAMQRVEQLLTKPAFQRVRTRDGDAAVDGLIGTRITVLEGDLPHVPELPNDLDLVVHCAGEVSFDPPIDEGFATNLFGSLALLEAVKASGSRPHYVHVSTAYVAGRREGHVGEGSLDHHVDWRAEAAAAQRLRVAT